MHILICLGIIAIMLSFRAGRLVLAAATGLGIVIAIAVVGIGAYNGAHHETAQPAVYATDSHCADPRSGDTPQTISDRHLVCSMQATH